MMLIFLTPVHLQENHLIIQSEIVPTMQSEPGEMVQYIDVPGTYNYDCSSMDMHLGMVGSITVEEIESSIFGIEVEDYYYAVAGPDMLSYLEVRNETYTSTNSLSINSGETLTGLDAFIGYVNDLPENSIG